MKRLLSAVLALVMMLSLSCVAFAASNTGVDNSFDNSGTYVPSGSTGSTSYTVTFEAGTGYDLTAQSGPPKNAAGDVVVGSVSGVISEKKIPGLTPADAYYAFSGWAIKDKNGNLTLIDLDTYRFAADTTVYAVVEDVWTPYRDMKQDRSDWYYQYVRDLSIAGVFSGFSGYVLRPQSDMTWGQALKLIMLATGYEVQAPTVEGSTFSGYLAKAKEDGLVPADLEVNLGKSITRLQFAEIAVKALKLEEVSIKTPYIDTDAMAALQLYSVGIMIGSYNTNGELQFQPDRPITRAHISAVIWRINDYTAKKAAQ